MNWIEKQIADRIPAYNRFLFNRFIRRISKISPSASLLAYDQTAKYPPITPLSESLKKKQAGNGVAVNRRNHGKS